MLGLPDGMFVAGMRVLDDPLMLRVLVVGEQLPEVDPCAEAPVLDGLVPVVQAPNTDPVLTRRVCARTGCDAVLELDAAGGAQVITATGTPAHDHLWE